MEHIRIDEGVKRGPRKKVNRQPKASLTGQYLSPVEPERKQEIIRAAHIGLASGLTTDQIAAEYGVSGRTLRFWLVNDDKADQARKQMIDQELCRTGEELREAKHADSPLPLACAREEFRYWSWMAERRDSARYGPKQEVTHVGSPILNISVSGPVAVLPNPHSTIEQIPLIPEPE